MYQHKPRKQMTTWRPQRWFPFELGKRYWLLASGYVHQINSAITPHFCSLSLQQPSFHSWLLELDWSTQRIPPYTGKCSSQDHQLPLLSQQPRKQNVPSENNTRTYATIYEIYQFHFNRLLHIYWEKITREIAVKITIVNVLDSRLHVYPTYFSFANRGFALKTLQFITQGFDSQQHICIFNL